MMNILNEQNPVIDVFIDLITQVKTVVYEVTISNLCITLEVISNSTKPCFNYVRELVILFQDSSRILLDAIF